MSETGTRRPLPAVPHPDDPDFRRKLNSFLEQLVASGLDAPPTRRELFEAGIADLYEDGQRRTSEGVLLPGPGELVLVGGLRDRSAAPPTTPTSVQVRAATVNIVIEWTAPSFAGYAFSEIWRSATNNRASAALIATSLTSAHADPVGEESKTYYYWVRHVNRAGVPGAFHAGPTSGQAGTTSSLGGGGPTTVFAPHKLWHFTNTLAGWESVSNVTLTPAADYLVWNDTGPSGHAKSDVISLNGAFNTFVAIGVRRVAGGGWSGKLQYSTSGHGFSDQYHIRFPDPGLDWKVILLDMSQLTVGGNDWITSTITGLQLYLGSGVADSFRVEHVGIGRNKESVSSLDGGAVVDATIANAKMVDSTIEGAKIAHTTITGSNIAAATIRADTYLELRNSQIIKFADPVDDAHPLIVDFPVPSELAAGGIQGAKLSFKIRPFRAYSKAGSVVAGGETPTSTANVPAILVSEHLHGGQDNAAIPMVPGGSTKWPIHHIQGVGFVGYGPEPEPGEGQFPCYMPVVNGKVNTAFGEGTAHPYNHLQYVINRSDTPGLPVYNDSHNSWNFAYQASDYHANEYVYSPEGEPHYHLFVCWRGASDEPGTYPAYCQPLTQSIFTSRGPEVHPGYVYTLHHFRGEQNAHGGHEIVTNAHSHNIDFGIYEEALATELTVHASNDGGQNWTLVGGPWSTGLLEVDVLSHFSGAGWKALRFSSTHRCNVSGLLELKIDINA